MIGRARKQGVAVLAIKSLAKGKWPDHHPQRQEYNKCWYEPLTDPREMELALRFTLSQPVVAAIPPGHANLFRTALDIACRFQPLSSGEQQQAEDLAARQDVLFQAA